MDNKQKVAIGAPFILIVVMFIAFQTLSKTFGETLGWYLGLIVYWLVWGAIFPLWIIGKENILRIIQPRRLSRRVFILVVIPLLIACMGKLIPGMNYRQDNMWAFLMMISTALGNGFFEELMWRGVYMELFPEKLFFRMFWPSLWFALWHYAPGSVSVNNNVAALMVGAGVFGFYLSFLAKKTNTIWWSIVVHTTGGIIMVV